MSFFRNLRSSLTRGRSSSRDTTPVRNSRPGSVVSSLNSGSGHSKRRDSLDSRNESLFNRSDTFILDESGDVITPSHSNCSTLEKKSKKSKVLEKFSTFTKRKKNPAPSLETSAFEHHPSDNATNTYYKWQAEGGGNSLDYDSQNDPFNFLYEQQSSLKTLQQNGHSSSAVKDNTKPSFSSTNQVFDSTTYRKGKMPSDLKKQLKLLKEQQESSIKKENKEEQEDEQKDEEDFSKPLSENDKYKTVTLNSFRKSFREKFLQQQKEANHNPAWFVEVDPEIANKNQRDIRDTSKENRRDLLVFENDNYRPGSRSPIRDLNNRKPKRSPTRSPVKRNDTFKVERVSRIDHLSKPKLQENNAPSIRIEFKNSITPHIPGRMVPVGVAKPMPVQYYGKPEPQINTSCTVKTAGNTTSTRLNNNSPVRALWNRIQSPARATATTATPRVARYQTLVQIKNEKPTTQKATQVTQRHSKHSTRIQLNNDSMELNSKSPSFGKRYNCTNLTNSNSTYNKTPQTLQQTYFGDSLQTAKIPHTSVVDLKTPLTNRAVNYGGYKYRSATTSSSPFASATTLTPVTVTATASALRSTPSHSVHNINSSHHNNLSQMKYHNSQSQPRLIVTAQRRSRSPIKIPWR